jgi:UDP-N-acetyl-D-glucosamine dehydrogenase
MSLTYKNLIKKIKTKKAKIGIVGLGYVGLPLAIRFIKKKFDVVGVESDNSKISKLIKNKSYIDAIKKEEINYFKNSKNKLSTKFNLLKEVDIIIVCLPTPLKQNSTPDMSYVFNAAKKISKLMDDKILILESTVYPGATEEMLKVMKVDEKKIGKSLFIGYSPERENPGDKNFSYNKTPKVISGYSKFCLKLVELVYQPIIKKTYKAKNIKTAEMSKLLENIFRSVNISLINEMKIISKYYDDVDILDVIETASTKNFGFVKFLPGPGIGGHCIPVDPYYLSWATKRRGYDSKFIELAGNMTNYMPNWVVGKIVSFFILKKIKLSNLLIIGVSYKPDVDDDRESPAFKIMNILSQRKIKFSYHDPYFPKLRVGRLNKFNLKSIKLSPNNIKKFQATIIVTDHANIDYKMLSKNSKFIFDTRGVMRKNNIYNKRLINI